MDLYSPKPLNLSCPIHKGDNEPIVHVCLEPTCESKSLICVKCLLENHRDHKTISLKKLATNIEELRYDTTFSDSCKSEIHKIKNSRANCLSQVQQFRDTINKQIDKLEKIVQNNFLDIQKTIAALLRKEEQLVMRPFQFNNEKQMGSVVLEVNQHRKNYLLKKHYRDQLPILFKKITVDSNKYFTPDLIQSDQEIGTVFTSLFQIALRSKKYELPSYQEVKVKVIWNENLKHKSIEIKNNTISRTVDPTIKGGQVYTASCLTNVLLSDKSKDSYRWNFKIYQGEEKTGILIGMCNPERAIKQKFESFANAVWKKIGHQHYVFRSDGLVLSSKDAAINFKNKSFGFQSGDIVNFEYIPTKSKLILTNGNAKLVMDVEEPKGLTYVACAYIVDKYDRVQLIHI